MTTISNEARARDFIAKLARHDFSRAFGDFDEKMRAAMPERKLGEVWSAMEAQAGAFERVDSVTLSDAGDFHVVVAKASFARAPLVLRVALDGAGRVSGFFVAPGDSAKAWEAPGYADPRAFDESPVTVAGLPGTLTIPKNASRAPAIVLVHGSGPNDQDETIGPNKPFKDLAWGLATRGVVVLRYDKRTRVNPAGVRTQKEEVEDAAHAAVAFLRARPEVDPSRVTLLGHSQGGYLAPRIAKDDRGIARLVILGGSTRPLEDSILDQLEYFAKLHPGDKTKDAVEAARRLKSAVESAALKRDDDVPTPFGTSIPGAYFLDVRGYQPARVAAQLRIPMLVLQGERDYQVTVDGDYSGWKEALGRDKRATLRVLPSLNHLFMSGDGPPSPTDYEKPGHVDAGVVEAIAAFVK